MKSKVEILREKLDEGKLGGGIKRIEAQHKKGKLTAIRTNGQLVILRDDMFSYFLSTFIKKKYEVESEPYFPYELLAYSDWHQTLDYFSWLFKACYSHPNDLKKKHFNIRHIFENYLTIHKVELKKIKARQSVCFDSLYNVLPKPSPVS